MLQGKRGRGASKRPRGYQEIGVMKSSAVTTGMGLGSLTVSKGMKMSSFKCRRFCYATYVGHDFFSVSARDRNCVLQRARAANNVSTNRTGPVGGGTGPRHVRAAAAPPAASAAAADSSRGRNHKPPRDNAGRTRRRPKRGGGYNGVLGRGTRSGSRGRQRWR